MYWAPHGASSDRSHRGTSIWAGEGTMDSNKSVKAW